MAQQGNPGTEQRDLYANLGVNKTATTEEIKKAYRKLALKHHPDKGGKAEKFQIISGAWDVLEHERTRLKYNADRELYLQRPAAAAAAPPPRPAAAAAPPPRPAAAAAAPPPRPAAAAAPTAEGATHANASRWEIEGVRLQSYRTYMNNPQMIETIRNLAGIIDATGGAAARGAAHRAHELLNEFEENYNLAKTIYSEEKTNNSFSRFHERVNRAQRLMDELTQEGLNLQARAQAAQAARPPTAQAARPSTAQAARPPTAQAARPPTAQAARPPTAQAARPPTAQAAEAAQAAQNARAAQAAQAAKNAKARIAKEVLAWRVIHMNLIHRERLEAEHREAVAQQQAAVLLAQQQAAAARTLAYKKKAEAERTLAAQKYAEAQRDSAAKRQEEAIIALARREAARVEAARAEAARAAAEAERRAEAARAEAERAEAASKRSYLQCAADWCCDAIGKCFTRGKNTRKRVTKYRERTGRIRADSDPYEKYSNWENNQHTEGGRRTRKNNKKSKK
uniref:J domain-containing protein n=1 Tax=viral metagenome TaxID=1070528 RepID=A0A6C0AN38_9ZZZZ